MKRAFLAVAIIASILNSTVSALADCAQKNEANFWEMDDASNGNAFDPEIIQASEDPKSFPQKLTKQCGRRISFAQAFRRGVINVPLAGGRSFDFMPLFLQRKTEWSCVRIKPRIACVTVSEADADGGRKIILQSEIAPAEKIMPPAMIKVERDGRVSGANDYFALIPVKMKGGSAVYDIRDRVQSAMDKVSCNSDCGSMKGWAADRRIVEILRYVRLVQLPRSEVLKDVSLFLAKIGELNTDAQALQALIGANEISLDLPKKTAQISPFEIGDAIDADSGPSFGVHQIDVATNACKPEKCERQPFRDALARLKKRPDAPQDFVAALTSAAAAKTNLFEKPIRTYTPEELGVFHRSVPLITEELRGETGMSQYLNQYGSYLKTDTGCMAALRKIGDPFVGNLGIQLYAVDVKNQFGKSEWLVRLARERWSQHHSSDQVLQDMLQEVRDNTKQGREHPEDVSRRQRNLQKVLDQFNHSTSGGIPSNCDVDFTSN
jgi:hypothetical protein